MQYVHGYTVKDRIDSSTFSSVRETRTEQNVFAFQPNENDYVALNSKEMSVKSEVVELCTQVLII